MGRRQQQRRLQNIRSVSTRLASAIRFTLHRLVMNFARLCECARLVRLLRIEKVDCTREDRLVDVNEGLRLPKRPNNKRRQPR